MKKLKAILLLLICIWIFNPQIAKADTVTVLAGEAIVTQENFEALAYKEMVRISALLITDPVQYMIEYNAILTNYAQYIGDSVTMYDLFSDEDILYLEKAVETETFGGVDFISKVHIAHVIMNRMMDAERFPSTIKQVVTSPGQFAYSKNDISPLTIAACEYAAINPDTTMGALWFHSGEQTTTFNGGEYLFSDLSGHHFYR